MTALDGAEEADAHGDPAAEAHEQRRGGADAGGRVRVRRRRHVVADRRRGALALRKPGRGDEARGQAANAPATPAASVAPTRPAPSGMGRIEDTNDEESVIRAPGGARSGASA